MRFLRFRRWLEQLDLDAGPIAAIHFEEVRRHVGTDAAHVYGGNPFFGECIDSLWRRQGIGDQKIDRQNNPQADQEGAKQHARLWMEPKLFYKSK